MISQASVCEVCAQDLRGAPSNDHETQIRIDIVSEKFIDYVDAEIKCCPACDAMVKGVFPPDMHGLPQFGDDLKAFVIN